MNYFVSYRHTGAEAVRLRELQLAIKEAFDERGDTFYSTYFRQEEFNGNNMSYSQILVHALSLIDRHDAVFVILDSEEKSEGMLIEIGYCIATEKPFIVAINKAVQGFNFPEVAQNVIEYESIADLKNMLLAPLSKANAV